MQVNFQPLIILVCAFSILASCSTTVDEDVAAVTPLPNVQPPQLFLGQKVGDIAERCVYAVQVNDAKLACEQNRCGIQAFYWPVQAIENGQRALLVSECANSQHLNKGDLLTNKGPTGDSGVLIFQTRRQGEGVWQNIELPNGAYGVQLATEAAEGILTYEAGQYAWEENPD